MSHGWIVALAQIGSKCYSGKLVDLICFRQIRDWDEDYSNLSPCLNKFYCDLIQRWIGVGYSLKLKDIASF